MSETFRRTAQDHTSTKSQTKFFWDFRVELEKRIAELETSLPTTLSEYFTVDSIHAGASDLKVRLTDRDESDIILMIIFRYHHADEKYGNVHIEITLSGLSREKKVQFLGKFLVTDKKKIGTKIVEALTVGMKAAW